MYKNCLVCGHEPNVPIIIDSVCNSCNVSYRIYNFDYGIATSPILVTYINLHFNKNLDIMKYNEGYFYYVSYNVTHSILTIYEEMGFKIFFTEYLKLKPSEFILTSKRIIKNHIYV